MAAPSVQIAYNDEEIKVFWNYDPTGVHVSFNLYWSVDSGMAGAALVVNASNIPDAYYSSSHIVYKFKRATLGLTLDSVFYLRLTGVFSGGSEDPLVGLIKYVPSLSEQLDQNKAVEIHGYDYTNKMWRKVGVSTSGTII